MKHSQLGRVPFRAEWAASHLPAAPGDLLHPEHAVSIVLPPEETLCLETTLRSGQIFRWRQIGGVWYGAHGQGSLALQQNDYGIEVRALGGGMCVREAWEFLGLDLPLNIATQRLRSDRHVAAAMAAYPGLRLLRQDPWDCLLYFLCSQLSNIPKIELCTERVAQRWGRRHYWPEGVEVTTLPAIEQLAAVPESELRECALGYRAPYLRETAQALQTSGLSLATLRSGSYEAGLASLLALPGVGRKVADCVLLFSLDQPHAFPVDVWVRRAVRECYPRALRGYLPDGRETATLSSREHEAMVRFAWERWGRLAGLAQQYLFHARRLRN